MAYYAAGKRCTACSRAVTYRTPRGLTTKWTDEKGRCGKCVQINKPTRDEWYEAHPVQPTLGL